MQTQPTTNIILKHIKTHTINNHTHALLTTITTFQADQTLNACHQTPQKQTNKQPQQTLNQLNGVIQSKLHTNTKF